MDQRSQDIRYGDTLESGARQVFGLKHQVAERPWMAVGAAVAAGYLLGSIGSEREQRWHGQPLTTTDYNQHASEEHGRHITASEPERPRYAQAGSFLSQFDDEIDLLKTAAIVTLKNYARDIVNEYSPSLGRQLDQAWQRDRTPSTAQGASRYSNPSGAAAINTEGIPTTTSFGSNLVDRASEHATPYYPPGSSGVESDR
jgi:hypothetical protein